MARFLFPLFLVLIFNSPSHLVMSKRESHVAPDHHHSSQIVNFSAGTSQVNVPKQQNLSSSSSLSQLKTPFHIPPSSSAAARNNDNNPKMLGIHKTQTPSVRSQQTTSNNENGDDGHGRRNNDHFVPTPADYILRPQLSTRLSKSRYRRGVAVPVPVPSFWSFLVSDTTRESTERQRSRKRRSPPTTKPTNGGILQASSNSNLSFVQDQDKLVLKLDRNYTPKDIAEYILSTGDERGIIQVVADMVQDGQLMASRDDVILFLETVQRELNKLKALNQLHRPSPPA